MSIKSVKNTHNYARLRELHPYELPAMYALPLAHASPAYAQWVLENTIKK